MKFLCALCVLCGLQSFALDREAFTFTNYDLDVRVEPEQQRLAARGKLTLRNDSTIPQKNLSLQISSTLDWRSIQFEGKPVQFVSQVYTSDIDHTGALSEAIVTLPQAVPPKGSIGLFNRSHYEDVIAVRVHGLAAEPVWRRRFEHINAFERMLSDEGVVIRKFFLHISKEEQRERLEERLSNPAKNWKFRQADLAERTKWEEYSAAYEEVLQRCSTAYAPWYVVPADKNKPRDFLVAEVLVRTLELMDPRYPPADPAVESLRGTIR